MTCLLKDPNHQEAARQARRNAYHNAKDEDGRLAAAESTWEEYAPPCPCPDCNPAEEIPPMNYEIQISEEQRLIIVEAFRLAAQLREPGDEEAMVEGLFHTLPAAEERDPGALHSFVY